MSNLDIYKLGKEDLIKLRGDIDLYVAELSPREQEESLNYIKSFNKISEMKHGGKIFCIQFYNNEVHNHDFVDISFTRWDEDEWVSFSTLHKTKPMGCSSSIRKEDLEGHCFLDHFFGGSWYFYTLKPESIEKDLKKECDKFFERKIKQQEMELSEIEIEMGKLYSLSNKLVELIKNSKQVV